MNQIVRDVMRTPAKTLNSTDTVIQAANLMRDNDIGDVIVLDNNHLAGILTDRDIVVRALAEGRDATRTTVGEICSRVLTTIAPEDSVGQAVRLMRDKALRRLPVEHEGRVLGIVTLGDIAVARDHKSALAEISAAPPNV